MFYLSRSPGRGVDSVSVLVFPAFVCLEASFDDISHSAVVTRGVPPLSCPLFLCSK